MKPMNIKTSNLIDNADHSVQPAGTELVYLKGSATALISVYGIIKRFENVRAVSSVIRAINQGGCKVLHE